MRAVPWLLARVNPQIPTAVFTSPDRGTGAWLRGRTRQILPAASLPDIARHCQILPNIAQILPDIARYCQILPETPLNPRFANLMAPHHVANNIWQNPAPGNVNRRLWDVSDRQWDVKRQQWDVGCCRIRI